MSLNYCEQVEKKMFTIGISTVCILYTPIRRMKEKNSSDLELATYLARPTTELTTQSNWTGDSTERVKNPEAVSE